ncbi:hypothetical protein [Cryptosporangium phraense]|uniref:WD40 repeat domain-containing protein n=1 Tax=Cryptosporangium phraense TaxID=2593070 RepID=A0A545AHX9_9ACTN|nr:hypothetical protein [Cryptosporangium phraense]TQS40934.1 hypothetical protein FL583_32445 [Cryptosporangium phraense]
MPDPRLDVPHPDDPQPEDHALGDVLMRTLNRAADGAPPPPDDLYRVVSDRAARRRSGLTVVATAVAVLLVLGTVGLMKVTGVGEKAPVAERPASAEQLWPDAVTKLPSSIGGRTFTVDAVLPDRHIVIHTFGTPGNAELRLVQKGADNLTARLIASFEQSPKNPAIISSVQADSQRMAWRVHRAGFPERIYSYRWSDRKLTLLDEVAHPRDTFSVTLAGDQVVYGPAEDGIRTVPADGGAPHLLDHTAHSYEVYWPWLVLNPVAPESLVTAPPTLWNVDTGQHWIANFHPTSRRDACSPIWCVEVGDGGYPVTTQRVDGSNRRTWDEFESSWSGLTPLRHRYLPVFGHSIGNHTRLLQLLDLAGDRTVPLGYLTDDDDLLAVALHDDVVAWPADGGRTTYVLDMDRIR